MAKKAKEDFVLEDFDPTEDGALKAETILRVLHKKIDQGKLKLEDAWSEDKFQLWLMEEVFECFVRAGRVEKVDGGYRLAKDKGHA
jgi:hypothetical protein